MAVAALAMGMGALTACSDEPASDSAPAAEPANAEPANETASSEQEGANWAETSEPETSEPETSEPMTSEQRWIDSFEYAFRTQWDPEPTSSIDGKTITFTFSEGSVDLGTSLHCPIGVVAFGTDYPDWSLVMAYPDGSLSCTEVMN